MESVNYRISGSKVEQTTPTRPADFERYGRLPQSPQIIENNIVSLNRSKIESLFAYHPDLSPEAQSAELITQGLLKNLTEIWSNRSTNQEVKAQKTDALILGLISTLSILSVLPFKSLEDVVYAHLPEYIKIHLVGQPDFPKLATEISYKLQSILPYIQKLSQNENQSYFQPA
jgi:hypothetical protein